MNQANSKNKRLAALTAALLLAATSGQVAHAFNFETTDLVLAIYGNTQEALVNLSETNRIRQSSGSLTTELTMSQLTADGTSHVYDITPFMNAAGVNSNPTQTKFTVFGFDSALGPNSELFVKFGSGVDKRSIVAGLVFQGFQLFNQASVYSLNVSDANAPNLAGQQNGAVLGAGSTFSFTGQYGVDDTMLGMIARPAAARIDSLLNIFQGNAFDTDPNTALSQTGQAIVQLVGNQWQLVLCGNSSNACTQAPIPVPAAAILFGTGLIGLAGVARRSLGGRAAA